jgi:hypothetical protein
MHFRCWYYISKAHLFSGICRSCRTSTDIPISSTALRPLCFQGKRKSTERVITYICKRSNQFVPLPCGGCTSNIINLTRTRLRWARLGVIQPPVLEEELTLSWFAAKRIVPIGFWSRVRVDNSAVHVYGVKVEVHEQQRGNEFDIESRKS